MLLPLFFVSTMSLAAPPAQTQADPLCVSLTTVCAPPGSSLSGTMRPAGGSVTVVPSAPVEALGARFIAGVPILVTVQVWGSGKSAGKLVHVEGELDGAQTVAGVPLSGRVKLGQGIGDPTVVGGTTTAATTTTLLGTTLAIPAQSTLSGGLTVDGGTIEVRATDDVTVDGVTFSPTEPVRVGRSGETLSLSGAVRDVQRVAGVAVRGSLWARLTPAQPPTFHRATLAADTELSSLGLTGAPALPAGRAPAGTTISLTTIGLLLGAPRVTVCGHEFSPEPAPPHDAAVRLQGHGDGWEVTGHSAAGLTVPAPAAFDPTRAPLTLRGRVAVTFTGGCEVRALHGVLSRAATVWGVPFQAGHALRLADETVQGTTSRATPIAGFVVSGLLALDRTPDGAPRVATGTLAAPGTLDGWQLPAHTQLQQASSHWQFTTPPRTPAQRAAPLEDGTTVGPATFVRHQGGMLSMTFASPVEVAGVRWLALDWWRRAGRTRLRGTVADTQMRGAVQLLRNASAMLCGGRLQSTTGSAQQRSFQVGRFHALSLRAGSRRRSPPESADLDIDGCHTGAAGFWLQVDASCHRPGGRMKPPPTGRWVFVDENGEALDPKDKATLAQLARTPAPPCPPEPCCHP